MPNRFDRWLRSDRWIAPSRHYQTDITFFNTLLQRHAEHLREIVFSERTDSYCRDLILRFHNGFYVSYRVTEEALVNTRDPHDYIVSLVDRLVREHQRRSERQRLATLEPQFAQNYFLDPGFLTTPTFISEEAKNKAEALFAKVAGDTAYQILKKTGRLPIKGSLGTEYLLFLRRVYCIEQPGVADFCATVEGVPLFDQLLSIKLLIEQDEAKFLRVANRRELHGNVLGYGGGGVGGGGSGTYTGGGGGRNTAAGSGGGGGGSFNLVECETLLFYPNIANSPVAQTLEDIT